MADNKSKAHDIAGQRFNYLTAVRRVGATSNHISIWECFCDCGTTSRVMITALRAGTIKSCGCQRRTLLSESHKIHGMEGTATYRTWNSMLARCTNPSQRSYPKYGGRGITVCDSWRNFANFYKDMGKRPAGKTLDRIDNERGYEPSNCRWATPAEQQRNRRITVRITYGGLSLTRKEWADRLGVPVHRIKNRHKAGMPIHLVLRESKFQGQRITGLKSAKTAPASVRTP